MLDPVIRDKLMQRSAGLSKRIRYCLCLCFIACPFALLYVLSTKWLVKVEFFPISRRLPPKPKSFNPNNGHCPLYEADPFDPAIASYFDDTPFDPCPEYRPLFEATSPTSFRAVAAALENETLLRSFFDKTSEEIPSTCKYTVIEGPGSESANETSFQLRDAVEVNASFVKITCDRAHMVHYVNLPFRVPEVGEEKRKIRERAVPRGRTAARPFSIYNIGLDSVSRSNSIRQLPKTREYLLKTLNATEFLAYNKIGLNTRPNVGAIFTGDIEGLIPDKIGHSVWNDFLSKVGLNCCPNETTTTTKTTKATTTTTITAK